MKKNKPRYYILHNLLDGSKYEVVAIKKNQKDARAFLDAHKLFHMLASDLPEDARIGDVYHSTTAGWTLDPNMAFWGRGPDGRRRKPCPENPVRLLGQPIGQYHCPFCGDMQMAGMSHLSPDEGYEALYEQPWPAGYVGD